MTFHTALLSCLLATSLFFLGCGKKPAPDFDARLASITETVELKLEKLAEGDRPDLRSELSALDKLAIEESGSSAENAAAALRRKADFQIHYLEERKAGTLTLKELIARFPETAAADKAATMLASLQIQADLVPGAWFPDFKAKDLSGARLSVSQFKGKILLVDFWATWCPPCLAELPAVKAAYSKFHDKGFEIVGISLDTRVQVLTRFIEREGITWAQTCELLGWDSLLVKRYGIMSIPSTYLLDRDGRIVATDPRGEDLENHLTALLGGE